MRKRSGRFLLILAAAAMPLAGAAADEAGSRQQLPSFEQLDANHDGVLSRSELPDRLQDLRMHFSQYAYADNRISRAMYDSYAAPALPLPEIHFARPRGRYAYSQPYIRRPAPGATPTSPVHKR